MSDHPDTWRTRLESACHHWLVELAGSKCYEDFRPEDVRAALDRIAELEGELKAAGDGDD
jgi:hypothetical protein